MRIVESGSPIGILIELPRIKCTKHRGQAITITQLASMTYIKPLVYVFFTLLPLFTPHHVLAHQNHEPSRLMLPLR